MSIVGLPGSGCADCPGCEGGDGAVGFGVGFFDEGARRGEKGGDLVLGVLFIGLSRAGIEGGENGGIEKIVK